MVPSVVVVRGRSSYPARVVSSRLKRYATTVTTVPPTARGTVALVAQSLRDEFLHQAPPAVAKLAREWPDLEAQLQRLVDRAAQAQPQLDVDAPGFVAYVAERMTVEASLDTLHAGDLCLAFACVLGDPTGLAILDRNVIARSAGVIRGSLPPGLTGDEVLQRLRMRLLVRDGDRMPGLSTYSGRGPLLYWSRATAVRLVQEFARSTQREVATDAPFLEAPALGNDPDLSLLKRQFAGAFDAAFKTALAKLSQREKHLLRLHYVEGMRAEELGRIFDTHRTTVWRWLTQCRESLLASTRAELAKTVKDSELSSLMNAVHSQLNVSLSRFLRDDGKE
jgi:RNA polymerase sigma-70 factor, ECF subfamily